MDAKANVPNELFPIQRDRGYGAKLFVPWSIGVEAWDAYAREHGTEQSVEEIARRQGFGESEMDEFRPGWREFIVGGERAE